MWDDSRGFKARKELVQVETAVAEAKDRYACLLPLEWSEELPYTPRVLFELWRKNSVSIQSKSDVERQHLTESG